MFAALGQVEGVTWVSIIIKTFAYGATLNAIGAVLIVATLQGLGENGRVWMRRMAVISAIGAAILTLLRLPVRASFLMGGTWQGAFDPMILGMVADSPLGTSVAVRLVGLACILCVIWPARIGQGLALAGAGLAAVSFALRGHALGDGQMILGVLITIHILCLAFWVGAFVPLARSARLDPPAHAGAIAHEFGQKALWVVGVLVLAGGGGLMILGAVTPDALSTPYGQFFAIKLILFAGVMCLAALNKLSLTPALVAAMPGANMRLRRSIQVETALIGAILAITATLTTISSP
jgi:putative copper resistance protein D